MIEQRPSVNPTGYAVTTDGRILSYHNGRYGPTRTTPMEMKTQTYKYGRRYVQLRDKNGRRVIRKVASMVLETFVGPAPDGMEALHKNGNAADDHIDNLRWGTHQENIDDRTRHGTTARGMKNGRCKLSDDDIRAIRGMTAAQASTKYGISRSYAAYVIKRKHRSEVI